MWLGQEFGPYERTVTMVAIVATSLLSVGLVAALSTAGDADANHRSTTSQSHPKAILVVGAELHVQTQPQILAAVVRQAV